MQRDKVRKSLDRLRVFSREETHDESTDDLDVNMDKDIRVSPTRIAPTMDSIEDYLKREYKNSFACQYLMLGLISHGVIPPHQDSGSCLSEFGSPNI